MINHLNHLSSKNADSEDLLFLAVIGKKHFKDMILGLGNCDGHFNIFYNFLNLQF